MAEEESDRVTDRLATLKSKASQVSDNVDAVDTTDPRSMRRLLADAIVFKSPLEDIKIIIKCGANINRSIEKGLFPIHYAAYHDNIECLQLLLEMGADINAEDSIGYTPLHLCARRGNIESMKVLIEHGAILNFCQGGNDVSSDAQSRGYLTMEPLNLAIESNFIECVRLLLDNGAKADNQYFMGYEINLAPLENHEILELLLNHGADPNVVDRCGITPLMKACKEHEVDALRLLLRYKADVNMQGPPRFEQKAAIHFAIESGNILTTSILLEHGAKMERLQGYKYSALHLAVLKGRSDICEMLIEHGANVNEKTEEDVTPLMYACGTKNLKDRLEIVELLLKAGADVNAHARYTSFTEPFLAPLTEYLKHTGNTEAFSIVLVLLRYGARVHFRGTSSSLRVPDPFGVLQHVSCLKNFIEMFEVIVSAAHLYNRRDIDDNDYISKEQREMLLQASSCPRDLKHQVRMYLRTNLSPDYPRKVNLLPLPVLLKSYLLFKL